MVGVSAKKFALHAQNTPKSAFYGVLGELIRGRAAGEAVLGEFFRGGAAGAVVLGELIRGRTAGGAVLGELIRGGAAGEAVLGEFADRQSWDPAGLVVLRRGPGSRPFDWQC